MKKFILKADIQHYHNGDHVSFNNLAVQILEKNASVIAEQELVDAYTNNVKVENTVYKLARNSEYTAKKITVDRQRNKLYSIIGEIVRLNMKHFNPAIRDAAKQVDNLMSAYRNLARAGYEAETASIDSFLTHIHSDSYAGAISILGLCPWLLKLKEANDLFKTYADNMMQEEIAKPDINMQSARRQSDIALHKIIARIESKINLNGPEPFIPFMEEYNISVKHYDSLLHEHYGRRHIRTDISNADIATVGQQQYTGKPVFVIPEVSLRETSGTGTETLTELVFTRDFTVSYKNNIKPGTATLAVQGIGKYSGKVVTTFNIIETLTVI
jgi:hypothetical protein